MPESRIGVQEMTQRFSHCMEEVEESLRFVCRKSEVLFRSAEERHDL